MTATVTGDALPVIRDFGRDATDPARYARLNPGWSLAVADIEASTRLVDEGRHRDVNFVAAAVVAAVSAAIRDGGDQLAPVAAQFGGDGAVIAVPPGRHGAVREALGALAGWAKREVGLTLRVGLVGVAELEAAGHDTLAALLDVGSGNSFGLFLGSGPGTAESWL